MRFVGPGLELSIEAVNLAPDGTASVTFELTDMEGRPLDREGFLTEGAVSTNFIFAWLDETDSGESLHYHAYTVREQTSPITDVTETQSGTDTGGDYVSLGEGRYVYTLGTPIDVEDQEDKTHTLGVYATREFRGLDYVANETFSFVPSGDEVSTTLDVVTTEACSSCHSEIEAHGGARRGVEVCVLCHTPDNSIDPDTGNTFDFQVMIHKIHRGADLPSVQAGEPYQIIGFRQSVHDYSDVHYPGELANCGACHAGSQGSRWETRLSVRTCASCHDRTYYGEGEPPEGFVAHTAGPREESECIVCHADDSISPVYLRHQIPLTDPERLELSLQLVGVAGTSPGSLLRLTFNVTLDGDPVDVLAEPLDRLRMTIAGPNTDYATHWTEDVHTAPECGSPLEPPCLQRSGSNFIFHAETPIPADASGSFTVGLEGRVIVDDVRHAALNPTLAFAVTGSATERRQVVSQEQCNSCHQDLAFHGNNRRSVSYCVMCHNANLGVGPDLLEGEQALFTSGNFRDLIHHVHAEAHYPDSLANCAHCHLDGTTELPLDSNLLPSKEELRTCLEDAGVDEDGDCDPSMIEVTRVTATPPESAACLGCHSAPETRVHAEVNTSPSSGAESCATCHGPGSSLDVEFVHAPAE